MGCVYCITNLINGKRYVGITTRSLNQRWKEHCSKTTRGPLKQEITKCGKEFFIIEELEKIDCIQTLYEHEKFWIRVFKTFQGHGYNLTRGGEGNIGYTHSDKIKQHFSQQRRGRKLTQKWKDAISRGQSGKINSDETKEKMSKSKSHLKKPVIMTDVDGRSQTFDSIKDAERWLRLNGYPSASKQYIRKAARTNSNSYERNWQFISDIRQSDIGVTFRIPFDA